MPVLYSAATSLLMLKAKSHYTSWFGAGSKLVRSQIPLRYLIRTSFEPASVMEFGFYILGLSFEWLGTLCREPRPLRPLT